MKFVKMTEHCNYFEGAVNIGYVNMDGQGLLIDSGIDKSTAKKILKTLRENHLPLDHVILSHAHTDHFGGASYLQNELQAILHSPKLEAAIMENPVLEPIYLWNGAMPIKQLRNKFLEAEPVTIDRYIYEGKQNLGPFSIEAVCFPGHSYAQMAILIDGILYAADSYFGSEVLAKHKVPFIVDADATINSLEKLRELTFKGALPGHGKYETNIEKTLQANIDCHTNIKQFLSESINAAPDGISMDELLIGMFEFFGLKAREIGQWLLYRTSFTAYISSLIEKGEVTISINKHVPWLKGNPLKISE